MLPDYFQGLTTNPSLQSRYSFYDHVVCTSFPPVTDAVNATVDLRARQASTDFADGLLLGWGCWSSKVTCPLSTACHMSVVTHHHDVKLDNQQRDCSWWFDTVHRHCHIHDIPWGSRIGQNSSQFTRRCENKRLNCLCITHYILSLLHSFITCMSM